MKRSTRRLVARWPASLCLTAVLTVAGWPAPAAADPFARPQPWCQLPEAPGDVRCPEEQLFDEIGAGPVAVALTSHRFDQLEADFAQWCSSGERRRDGQWRLVDFRRGVDRVLRQNRQSDWSGVLTAWRQAFPESVALRLAEATGMTRGYRTDPSDRAGESPEARLLTRQAGARAWSLLQADVEGAGPVCPAVDEVALRALAMMEVDPATMRAAYDRAIKRSGSYVPLHQVMATHLYRQSGSWDEHDRFIDASDRRLSEAGESGLFARLHGAATLGRLHRAVKQGATKTTVPSRSITTADASAHWNRLASSYSALEARWPRSYSLLNGYAGAACLAGDASRYLPLREKLEPYRRWLAFPEAVDVCDLRTGYLAPDLRPPAMK